MGVLYWYLYIHIPINQAPPYHIPHTPHMPTHTPSLPPIHTLCVCVVCVYVCVGGYVRARALYLYIFVYTNCPSLRVMRLW